MYVFLFFVYNYSTQRQRDAGQQCHGLAQKENKDFIFKRAAS